MPVPCSSCRLSNGADDPVIRCPDCGRLRDAHVHLTGGVEVISRRPVSHDRSYRAAPLEDGGTLTIVGRRSPSEHSWVVLFLVLSAIVTAAAAYAGNAVGDANAWTIAVVSGTCTGLLVLVYARLRAARIQIRVADGILVRTGSKRRLELPVGSIERVYVQRSIARYKGLEEISFHLRCVADGCDHVLLSPVQRQVGEDVAALIEVVRA